MKGNIPSGTNVPFNICVDNPNPPPQDLCRFEKNDPLLLGVVLRVTLLLVVVDVLLELDLGGDEGLLLRSVEQHTNDRPHVREYEKDL